MLQGLSCFTCDTATTSRECNRMTNCSALNSLFAVCKTTIMSPDVGFPFKGDESVVRQCAQTCIPTGQNWIGITKKIICCNLDFCNRQGINGTSSTSCTDSAEATATFSFVTTFVSVLAALSYAAL
ncbi:ly6/PLAUR domain-containing protein 2-like isoform X2 [Mixophyes fleayi]|uniref:ly6/PLAUR domain-containing protein 2-like isoform X2 n=1 Tax=Mixophyes fleayi TaxID=3061075 RepID=UPI003F4E41EB